MSLDEKFLYFSLPLYLTYKHKIRLLYSEYIFSAFTAQNIYILSALECNQVALILNIGCIVNTSILHLIAFNRYYAKSQT